MQSRSNDRATRLLTQCPCLTRGPGSARLGNGFSYTRDKSDGRHGAVAGSLVYRDMQFRWVEVVFLSDRVKPAEHLSTYLGCLDLTLDES